MAIDLIIPDKAYSEISVPLNGVAYTLTSQYNTRDGNWRLSVGYLGTTIFLPETVKPETPMFERQDQDILGGWLYCHRLNEESKSITRDNFTRDFVIRFYTSEELVL